MISYNSQCPLINSFLGSSPFLIFLLLGKCTNEFNDSCNILLLACMSCLQSIFLSFNITNQQRVYWPVFATKAFLCCGCRSCQSIIVLALAVPLCMEADIFNIIGIKILRLENALALCIYRTKYIKNYKWFILEICDKLINKNEKYS